MRTRKRQGPWGCASVLLGLAVFAVLWWWRGPALFSPGPLSAQQARGAPLGGVPSHAALEKQCRACHAPLQVQGTLCLDCHTAVDAEIAAGQGLHARFAAPLNCRTCHPDHRGRQADMLSPARVAFDHAATGFSLRQHVLRADFTLMTCRDCHDRWPTAPEALRDACVTCHAQAAPSFLAAHRRAFGQDCLACHDGVDRFTGFDHAQTGFLLEGAHGRAACEACHVQTTTLAALRATPADCVACHRQDDAHGGAFGTGCEACHRATTWEDVTFDHAQTAFPLTGAHAGVACTACHAQGRFEGTSPECQACHAEPDVHRGLFGQQCAYCHTTQAWSPARLQDHPFPVTHGGNPAQTCETCHPGNRYTETTCYGCHEHTPDEVRREHAEEGIGPDELGRCVACHPDGR